VAGSAGTGKTIVALHRAVFWPRRHPEARVLLTTFSTPWRMPCEPKLRRLISNAPRIGERLEVHPCTRLAGASMRCTSAVQRSRRDVITAPAEAAREVNVPSQPAFFTDRMGEVVDAWQLDTWEAYRGCQAL